MRSPIIIFDVETSGPVPNQYSMMSLGAVLLDGETLEVQAEFYQKIQPWYSQKRGQEDVWSGFLMDHIFDAETWRWWQQFPEQLAEAQRDARYAPEVMRDFIAFATEDGAYGGPVTLVSKPAAFDGMFFNHYMSSTGHRYEDLPWKHRVMDVASLIVGMTGCDYHDHKVYLPMIEGHNHKPIDDAHVLAQQLRILLQQVRCRASAGSLGVDPE